MKTDAYLPVYVYNSVEDEWSYIGGLKKKDDRKTRITLSNAYADSYLFANAGRKKFVFVSPVAIPEEFISYFEEVTSSRVTVITVDMTAPFICENLANDSKSLESLRNEAKGYGGIALYPYASTLQVYKLKESLEKCGIKVTLPESPRKQDFWTVTTYGSKSGFRELISSVLFKKSNILLPQGTVSTSLDEVLNLTTEAIEKKGAVLLKISKGSGGHGTYILKRENPLHTRGFIRSILTSDPLWSTNKIVVEEFVETDPASRLKYPSVECYVDSNGKNRVLYCCNMLVTDKGNFYGMEVGREAIPDPIRRRMHSIGKLVGQVYATNGYRGHFDIDMIRSKDKTLYVNESNIRNTGGTDAYKLAHHLLGQRLLGKSFILSKYYDFPEKSKILDFSSILKKLQPVLYNPATKKGIIISSQSSLLERSITYFIIMPDRKSAYAAEQKLLSIISHD